MLKGTLYVYQGEELGMTNYHFESIDEFQDLDTIGKYKVLVAQEKKLTNEEFMYAANKMSREHGRTAMQWSCQKGAGFSNNSKVIVNPNHTYVNVDSELQDENSILNFYKKMIAFRNENQDFFANARLEFDASYENNKQVIAFWRIYGQTQYKIIGNWSNEVASIDFDSESSYEIVIDNLNSFDKSKKVLQPWQVIVMMKKEK